MTKSQRVYWGTSYALEQVFVIFEVKIFICLKIELWVYFKSNWEVLILAFQTLFGKLSDCPTLFGHNHASLQVFGVLLWICIGLYGSVFWIGLTCTHSSEMTLLKHHLFETFSFFLNLCQLFVYFISLLFFHLFSPLLILIHLLLSHFEFMLLFWNC